MAKLLAAKIGYTCTDTDNEIEVMCGMSISAIFETHGETYFREVEQKALVQTADKQKLVVACGGGLPCFYDNMDWISQHGISIWLQAPIGRIVQRLLQAKGERPLIQEDIQASLEDLQKKRLPFYERANIHTLSDKHQIPQLVTVLQPYLNE